MKRNISFEKYTSENTLLSPKSKNYNYSNNSTTRNSQIKDKEDYNMGKFNDLGKSEIQNEDY